MAILLSPISGAIGNPDSVVEASTQTIPEVGCPIESNDIDQCSSASGHNMVSETPASEVTEHPIAIERDDRCILDSIPGLDLISEEDKFHLTKYSEQYTASEYSHGGNITKAVVVNWPGLLPAVPETAKRNEEDEENEERKKMKWRRKWRRNREGEAYRYYQLLARVEHQPTCLSFSLGDALAFLGSQCMKQCPMNQYLPYAMMAAGSMGTLAFFTRFSVSLYIQCSSKPLQANWPKIMVHLLEFVFLNFFGAYLYFFYEQIPRFEPSVPVYCNEFFYKSISWMNYASALLTIAWGLVYFIKFLQWIRRRKDV
ncbi:hypothetical protein CDAR_80841 [Caerostris darwini]|uniref:Uncharacterized protein n=1 Tax=Caerostris darwini TaxID=1538125 RepID=A0AAV4SB32_9ARAC|nr:hypothetical protein CDAR_80841 [Caerostris darwini]